MKNNLLIVASALYELEASGVSRKDAVSLVSDLKKKAQVIKGACASNGYTQQESQAVSYIAMKHFYHDRDLEPEVYFESLNELALSGHIPHEQVNFTALMRTSFRMNRFLLSLLVTEAISKPTYDQLTVEVVGHLTAFLAKTSKLIDEFEDPTARLFILNMAEGFLSDNFDEVLPMVAKSSELTSIFIDNPKSLLDKIFIESNSQLKIAIYGACEILGD